MEWRGGAGALREGKLRRTRQLKQPATAELAGVPSQARPVNASFPLSSSLSRGRGVATGIGAPGAWHPEPGGGNREP